MVVVDACSDDADLDSLAVPALRAGDVRAGLHDQLLTSGALPSSSRCGGASTFTTG
jgi:hypothetical protein